MVILSLVLCIVFTRVPTDLASHVLRIKGQSFVLGEDGPAVQIRAGEMHYFRVPEVYWEDRLKRLRAMGLNAVSTYVPWNWHEQTEGSYDFQSERKNVVKFLRLAKEQGLYVILRAGPYICAEWEFGGMPAWLLKYALKSGMRFRSSDSTYLSFVDRYWDQLLSRVRDELQENGGAVTMVQIENELGALQDPESEPDYAYMHHLWQSARRHLGDRVLLISTDNTKGNVKTDGVFQAVNLGPWYEPKTHLEETFTPARKINGGVGPDFVMELWAGWFQSWHTSSWDEEKFREPTHSLTSYVEELMKRNASFTLYMAHGGTNFGGWNSGTTVMWGPLDPQDEEKQTPSHKHTFLPFLRKFIGHPQVKTPGTDSDTLSLGLEPKIVHMSFVTSSYDYAAPISEDGRHGFGGDGIDKFVALRDVMAKYPSVSIPEEPAMPEPKFYSGNGPGGSVLLERRASLRDPEALRLLCDGGWQNGPPEPMELNGQQLGMVLYRFNPSNSEQVLIEANGLGGKLELKAKDRLTVWHGGDRILNLYSNLQHGRSGFQFRNVTTVPLQPGKTGPLEVLVENLGRRAYFCTTDYGYLPEFWNDWKGMAEVPLLGGNALEGDWSFCLLPLENLERFDGSAPPASSRADEFDPGPAFFEGSLHVDSEPVADTFLRLDCGSWNTGSAYLNGFHLGRYWRNARGPLDLYVPKSALHTGDNRVVILEMDPGNDWSSAAVCFSDKRGPTPF